MYTLATRRATLWSLAQGAHPASQTEFVRLVQGAASRANMSREWLRSFWGCTVFLGAGGNRGGVVCPGGDGQAVAAPATLRAIDRSGWAGGGDSCLLTDEQRRLLVAIDNGGIGKTALAYAVMEQALAQRQFDGAIWIGRSVAVGGAGAGGLTYAGALNAIGLGLGIAVAGRSIAAAGERIAALLRAQKFLLVLDNMETGTNPSRDGRA